MHKHFDVLFSVRSIYHRYWKIGSPRALCSEKNNLSFFLA